jgi:hypothetical protein
MHFELEYTDVCKIEIVYMPKCRVVRSDYLRVLMIIGWR